MGGIADIRKYLPGATLRYARDGMTQLIRFEHDGRAEEIEVPPGKNALEAARSFAEVKREMSPLALMAAEGILNLVHEVPAGDENAPAVISHEGETYELVEDDIPSPKPALFFYEPEGPK